MSLIVAPPDVAQCWFIPSLSRIASDHIKVHRLPILGSKQSAASYLLGLAVGLSRVVLLCLLGGSWDLPLALLELLGGGLRRHCGVIWRRDSIDSISRGFANISSVTRWRTGNGLVVGRGSVAVLKSHKEISCLCGPSVPSSVG